jgi:nicotinamide mononucleotide transporter
VQLGAEFLHWLNHPALSLWNTPVSWAELLGDVSGAACVLLVARQNVWNWPLGLVNNVFWCVLFAAAKLYADAGLQVVFFVLGVYGWWTWASGRDRTRAPLPVRRTTRTEWFWLGALTLVTTGALATLLALETDSPAPLWDSSVLSLSLAATYGQAQKLIESWYLWILVDVISVPLYLSRNLLPTALLYVVFACICVRGLINWRRSLLAQRADA